MNWTTKQERTLIRMWPDHSGPQIAAALGVPLNMVYARINYMRSREMNVPRRPRTRWRKAICQYCKQPFFVAPGNPGKYCSKSCSGKARWRAWGGMIPPERTDKA